jgi:membrane protein implicated in regulation of membrane protease activity
MTGRLLMALGLLLAAGNVALAIARWLGPPWLAWLAFPLLAVQMVVYIAYRRTVPSERHRGR